MKSFWIFVLVIAFFSSFSKKKVSFTSPSSPLPVTENLFIITTDGFRWQELFGGADSLLINNESYTPDTGTMKLLYWAATEDERRKRLMPFMWQVVNSKGQLFGNRYLGNKVDVANQYALSYPGYNEMFTGKADEYITSNRKKNNQNINVLEYLNNKPAFRNKVAAFTSWDVFPYIFNTGRNNLPLNSGYNTISGETKEVALINTVQSECDNTNATRHDELTFLAAKEYIRKNKPQVLYIGLGETDEFAHDGRYDLYLQQATKVDKMISELWHLIQTTPGYKDKTMLLITTDHGRGSRPSRWTSHGQGIKGSGEIWFAIMGPGIQPAGEVKATQQQYLQQMAGTIAGVLGEEFILPEPVPAFSLR